jgi:hypothetical protein
MFCRPQTYILVRVLEDWSGLRRELFVYRQSPFLFGRLVNFLKQYLTPAGKSNVMAAVVYETCICTE